MPAMKAGELFAGYGGLALAVEEVFNAETTWLAEYDTAPSKILAHRFPHVPNLHDVTSIDWAQIEPVNIISGGSPCQDISAAGAKRGMTEGQRSNLWVAQREAISVIRPDFVVWENVRGAFSAKADSSLEHCERCMGEVGGATQPVLRALGRVLGDLSTLGYDSQWRTVRASDVGAPHHRQRVFILAYRSDTYTWGNGRGEGWPESAQENSFTTELADMDQRPERRSGFRVTQEMNPEKVLLPTPACMDTMDLVREGEARLKARKRGQDRLRARTGNLREEIHFNFREYQPAIQHWERVLGRAAPSAAVPSSTGKPQLNPRFSEWLMGLPDGWVTSPDIGLSRKEQLKAIGNGVVPQQAVYALSDMLRNVRRI